MENVTSVKEGDMRIEIKNRHPVELMDLTRSFQAFADEYRRYAERESGEADQDDIRLYISRLETGSIIADIAAYAPAFAPLLPVIAKAYELAGYAAHIKKLFDFLTGRSEDPSEVTRTSLQNSIAIVDPIAKDGGSQLSIINNGNLYLSMSSTECNAAQNSARRLLETMDTPATGTHRNVVMYFHQARNEPGNSPGDRAIIESISMRPIKVKFAAENIKGEMLFKQENPFLEAYVVDVIVETVNGRPTLYNVTHLHEVMTRDDATP